MLMAVSREGRRNNWPGMFGRNSASCDASLHQALESFPAPGLRFRHISDNSIEVRPTLPVTHGSSEGAVDSHVLGSHSSLALGDSNWRAAPRANSVTRDGEKFCDPVTDPNPPLRCMSIDGFLRHHEHCFCDRTARTTLQLCANRS